MKTRSVLAVIGAAACVLGGCNSQKEAETAKPLTKEAAEVKAPTATKTEVGAKSGAGSSTSVSTTTHSTTATVRAEGAKEPAKTVMVSATPVKSEPFKIEPIRSVFDAPAAPEASIEIELNYADADDLKEWTEKAKEICVEWYPHICKELASEGYTPPKKTKFNIDPQMRGVAHTTRGQVFASANYIRQNPDDYGMMVHEMVHVVQAYPNRPKRAPGWVVEGIADYIRFHQYEPGSDKSRIDPNRASYRDSYRTTAAFFAWAVQNHDKEIIQKLNSSLRKGECDEEKTKELFGGDIDGLWARFLDEKVRK